MMGTHGGACRHHHNDGLNSHDKTQTTKQNQNSAFADHTPAMRFMKDD